MRSTVKQQRAPSSQSTILLFCSSCQSDHQRHPLARLVVSIPFNVIVFVAVFALQGYTPSSLWPSLAYLFYFYTMAAVVALRTYELQRLCCFFSWNIRRPNFGGEGARSTSRMA